MNTDIFINVFVVVADVVVVDDDDTICSKQAIYES